MNANKKRQNLMFLLLGMVLAAWIGLHIAPYWDRGLIEMVGALNLAFEQPLQITLCERSLQTVCICCGIYGVVMLYLYATHLNTRFGEEHGSAEWGDPGSVCRQLQDKRFGENRLLTQHVRIGYNFFRHHRTMNVLVVGGTGSRKTRSYAMPNVMQNNCSQIILDPMGEILIGCGKLLEAEGTEIRILDLIEMEKSHHYNPFAYLRTEKDVQTMTTNLFTATTPKEAKSQDPFWDNSAEMLLKAFAFYLWLEAPPEEQNFAMVMELLRCAAIADEDDSSAESITDVLFRELEERDPNHVAVRYYKDYRSGSGKTLKSIQLVLASHLEKFNLSSVAELTSSDELDLRSIGEKKVALFCRISDTDASLNFLVSMLYQQLFQQLFETADLKYHGKLPVHVHFLMDEFANVALPDDFRRSLSTMRKRNVSASIILQDISSLKALFKDQWESIIGNCDSLLYLGSNEKSTHEYISSQLGKQTIWTRSNSLTRGRSESSGRNDQTAGRDLLTADEVRKMDDNTCILLIRGFKPLSDLKYDLMRHPKIRHTGMGGGEEYLHDRSRIHNVSVSERTEDPKLAAAQTLEIVAWTESEVEEMLLHHVDPTN